MSIKSSEKLKALNNRKLTLEGKLSVSKQQQKSISKEVSTLKQELHRINQEIKELQILEPVVSDHAVLRYLERVHSINVTKIKEEIKLELLKYTNTLGGTGKFPINGGGTAIMKDMVVTTITE